MELGQRIKAARLEKGLSQRQLCGEVITRNMLSQIESGRARPSMVTLSYLAEQLGKSVSYFLDEDALTSPNQGCMERARAAFSGGEFADAVEELAAFREPDGSFVEEKQLILFNSYIKMAERAIQEQRLPYALSLLEKANALQGIYITDALRAQAQALAAMVGNGTPPDIDGILLLKAQRALDRADAVRAAAFLDSAEAQNSDRWRLLRGQAAVALGDYEAAKIMLEQVQCLDSYALLEVCCRETGDYKGAYEYACKRRAAGEA